jgi:orotidine-5'-phosphate decarboxylase
MSERTAMPIGGGAASPKQGRNVPTNMAERLILALDVRNVEEARAMVSRLDGVVSFFKLGLRLQYEPGFGDLLSDLKSAGKKIFLDAKMFDIPETVRGAVAAAVRRNVDFITVHGDEQIMRAAVEAKGGSGTRIFAVTVLTSLDDQALRAMGYLIAARDLVEMRAKLAVRSGCDGIIASADDQPDQIRRLAETDALLIATPGVRRRNAGVDDQKRIATPGEAIASGADYLVVGRPILQAADPVEEAKAFIQEMAEAASRAA